MEPAIRFRHFPDRIDASAWMILSKSMQKETTILNTRTAPENLAAVYEKVLALLLEQERAAVGFIAAWPVADGYVELGSAWIRPDCRGRGLGDRLYEQSRNLPGLAERVVFAVTQNPIALKAGRHAGLEPHTDWVRTIPWNLTCGPCDKWILDEEKHACPLRDRSCWLRIRRV